MPNFLCGNESPEEFVKAMMRKDKVKTIDKLDDRPWDIIQAFRNLNQLLAMEQFFQHNIIVDYDGYEEVQPDHVVVNHDA
jgi:hypothetical protein